MENNQTSSSNQNNLHMSTKSKSFSSITPTNENRKSKSTYGQFNLDFLHTQIEERVLHIRGKQKKHEADQEKDKIKKTIAYMEAVCYFCLCAISQYRLKKANNNSNNMNSANSSAMAANQSSNKSSIDLLNDTYQLLKYLNDKLVKPIENEKFTMKYRVLSNWMEAFINRWLWLMSLNDIRKLKDSIQKQSILLSSVNASISSNSSAAAAAASNAVSSTSAALSHTKNSTSPSELPPPSPASSIGSSAGSVNGSSNATHSSNLQSSTSTNGNDTIGSSSTQMVQQQTSQQQNQLDLMQKLLSLNDRYNRFNDYIIKSQTYWDSSEQLISEHDYLNGLSFFYYFI